MLLAFDLVVAAGDAASEILSHDRTAAVVDTHVAPIAESVRDGRFDIGGDLLLNAVRGAVRSTTTVDATRLAEGLADIAGISIAPEEVETNMVYFAVDPARTSAPELAAHLLAAHGVRVGPIDEKTLRAVTHLDVDASGIEVAIQAVREALAQLGGPRIYSNDPN